MYTEIDVPWHFYGTSRYLKIPWYYHCNFRYFLQVNMVQQYNNHSETWYTSWYQLYYVSCLPWKYHSILWKCCTFGYHVNTLLRGYNVTVMVVIPCHFDINHCIYIWLSNHVSTFCGIHVSDYCNHSKTWYILKYQGFSYHSSMEIMLTMVKVHWSTM